MDDLGVSGIPTLGPPQMDSMDTHQLTSCAPMSPTFRCNISWGWDGFNDGLS